MKTRRTVGFTFITLLLLAGAIRIIYLKLSLKDIQIQRGSI